MSIDNIGEEGFCDGCGCELAPADFLKCPPCYALEKATQKRRYKRATAEMQLEGLIKRTEYVASEPFKFHWAPRILILYGSMLKTDASKVGDIDLCLLGSTTDRLGLESFEALHEWLQTHYPRCDFEFAFSWPRKIAHKFIKGNARLASLGAFEGIDGAGFTKVGGGRRIPYRIIWRAPEAPAEAAIHATIERASISALADSIEARADSVRRARERAKRDP